MTRVNTEDEVDNENEEIPVYELYWAQNTTAHGLSRIANTSKFQRFIWIAALLGICEVMQCLISFELPMALLNLD